MMWTSFCFGEESCPLLSSSLAKMDSAHAPYIMPDGRPLVQFLQETQAEQPKSSRSSGQQTRRVRKAERSGGWSHKSVYRALAASDSVDNEAEDRAAKLGKDRRRRFLNDKILREMAGSMTLADMEAQFKPVPFGDTGYESPLTQATAPDISPIWDLFRNISEDKQTKTLQAWEAHIQSQGKRTRPDSKDGESCVPSMSGFIALKNWSRIPKKSRDVLKRSSASFVEDLELPMMEFMDRTAAGGNDAEPELDMELESGHQRLLVHAIATFHNLPARTLSDRLIRLHGHGLRGRGSPDLSCADIVFALNNNSTGGLNAQILNAHWRRMHVGSDTGSEAAFGPS